jgi:hypothetical protein
MRVLLGLLITCGVAACAEIKTEKLSGNTYKIEYWEPIAARFAAERDMDGEAEKLCPSGYSIEDNQAIPHPEKNTTYIWWIRCVN